MKARLLRCAAAAALLQGCAAHAGPATQAPPREDIYILRSIREPAQPTTGWCAAARTGFEPFPGDADRAFSFWSLQLRPGDGKLVDARVARVAALRGCFGPTGEPARQNFYAEIRLGSGAGSIALRGRGECLALAVDVPEPGLFPVRCQLVIDAAPPYAGGVLTTNTMTSKARFGGDTDPAGYTQASIATIRLWRAKP